MNPFVENSIKTIQSVTQIDSPIREKAKSGFFYFTDHVPEGNLNFSLNKKDTDFSVNVCIFCNHSLKLDIFKNLGFDLEKVHEIMYYYKEIYTLYGLICPTDDTVLYDWKINDYLLLKIIPSISSQHLYSSQYDGAYELSESLNMGCLIAISVSDKVSINLKFEFPIDQKKIYTFKLSTDNLNEQTLLPIKEKILHQAHSQFIKILKKASITMSRSTLKKLSNDDILTYRNLIEMIHC